MTDPYINESNMSFGPFTCENLFYIEQSNTYKAIMDNVQIAEFVHLQDGNRIRIIEAKSSAPHPGNKVDYDSYIDEIRDKLINAFSLTMASILRRHPNTYNEIPGPIQNLDMSKADFCLILVIHGHEESWLPQLQESFNSIFYTFIKTWALSPASVFVINDSIARKKNLIV
jgi:hypothetical protein